MKKTILLTILLMSAIWLNAQQVIKGRAYSRPTVGYGTDTIIANTFKNFNGDGRSGFIGVVDADSAYYLCDSTGKAVIYNNNDVITIPDTVIYGTDTLFVTNETWLQNGFTSAQRTNTTLSFDDGTLTLSITASSYPFSFYQYGKKYEIDAQDDVTITDTEGLWVVYYDYGVLTALHDPSEAEEEDVIKNKCIVWEGYWDATNNEILSPDGFDERHGVVMSPNTHYYLHTTRGAQYLSGLALNNFSVDQTGNSDAHAQFSVNTGSTLDEDISTTISAIGSTTGLPIYYLDGASVNLRRLVETGFSVLTDVTAGIGATGRVVYNQFTGGAWQLTVVTNNSFVLCHVFAVNAVNTSDRVVAVIGQNEYGNLAAARVGANEEISTIVTQFELEELVPIGSIIFQTSNSYANGVRSRVRSTDLGDDYVDWRSTEFSSGVYPAYHSNLTGLSNDDHAQYFNLNGRSGGQTAYGSTLASENLRLESTSHATKGDILVISDFLRVSNDNTDSNDKYSKITGINYDTDEEPVTIAYMLNESTQNDLRIGGGYASANSATGIKFYTGANITTLTGTEALAISSTQQISTGAEASPDCDPGGATLQHNANDGFVLTYKNTDVNHGITDVAETDTYGQWEKYADATGGAYLTGLTEDEVGIGLYGIATNGNTNSDATATGPIWINAAKKSGVTTSSLGSTENTVVIANNGNAIAFWKGDGQLYNDFNTAMTLFDKYEDKELLRALQLYTSNENKKANKHTVKQLENLGIIKTSNNDEKVYVSYQKMTGLQNGAIYQVNQKIDAQQKLIFNLQKELNKQKQKKRFTINLFPKIIQIDDTIKYDRYIIVDNDTIINKTVIYELDWTKVTTIDQMRNILNYTNKVIITKNQYNTLPPTYKNMFTIKEQY